MEEGSVVAALAGMAFVMVGLFQFLKGYIASTNNDYKKVRDELELVQRTNLELEQNNLYWKNKYLRQEIYCKELQRKLNKAHETIQEYLDKTNPIPDDL